MDENNMHVNERRSGSNVNGSVRRGAAPSNLPIHNQGTPPRPSSLMDSPTQHSGSYATVQVVVNRDEKGYGMKVSGDNPVYVQSVKAGGAAEKAGLYAGDKIIEVNGENVVSSTHTHVVGLIRSASQVVLTVQQRIRSKRIDSPSLHTRSATSPSPHQITGPQPVDHEKLQQFKLQKTRQLQLMIEKEERYLEQLRSQYALTPNEKALEDLEKTERNLQKLKGTLLGHVGPIEQSPPSFSTSHNLSNEMRIHSNDSPPNTLSSKSKTLPNSNKPPDVAPPLPKRNRPISDTASYRKSTQYANGLMINNPQNNNNRNASNTTNTGGDGNVRSYGHRRDRFLENQDTPPPLPPRNPRPQPMSSENDLEAANSISKQMSYPLVTTCATIINSYPLNHTHHRTKSSPESLLMMTPAEASRRLIASESMSDVRPASYGRNATPPGTPPPPYPNASPEISRRQSMNKDVDMDTTEDNVDLSVASLSKDVSLNKVVGSGDIHAASSQVAQQRIISMEDDEMSDQEVNQLDDHGPFKSLSRLWEHTPHLAVFMNYVLLNSDPNSLLFYLLTDLYKEGNAKDMRKWAYEIHSSFLVPGAPLRLANVDENIAHEIDDVLMREYDKEEILRKIFWKARNRAKEELTKQLNHFQQKRTAGLGTMYGPSDEKLFNMNHEKAKEMKIYDNLLVDKLDPYVEEIDKENYDPKKYYTAAALATVIIRIFGVRVVAPLDRFPTFVNKEKSFRTKFMKYSRKLTIQGHQFNAQQYYTVIVCNHCHHIIYGIGPQGYQCSVCLINLHRTCVKLYDDSCPGPINKKDRGIQKVMEKIGNRGPKRRSAPHSHLDRKQDEKDLDSPEVEARKNLYLVRRDEVTKKHNKMPNKKRRGPDSKQGKGSAKGGGTLTNNKGEKKSAKTDKNRTDLDDNKRTERRRTYSNNKKVANCDEVNAAITRVEIRHEVPNNRAAIVADVKRYSDSFIQAGGYKIDNIDSNLSRSRSGFLADDEKDSPKSDKIDRKSRRFSDIFRYGTSRGDVELVKSQEEGKMFPGEMKNKVNAADKAKKGKMNNAVKSASRNLAGGTPNKAEKTPTTCSDNNSYLKRVKSKICRTKNDESTIYENDENVKERSSLRSSVSHFDFRLIRQTSNLEKVRPSVLGHKKCASNVGVGETITDDKPVLAKSKSSSAINLGLLRTRRNKILEQLKKNVKPADSEFDFIAFARSQHNKTNFIEDPLEQQPETPTGDMKQNQSLSRTDSDRRPETKSENTSQDSQEHVQDGEEPVTSMENTKSLPPFTDKKKNATSINRSESVKESSEKQRKQRRNISDPLHNTSESGNIEATDLTWSGSTGSSSNTSINSNSRYSNESPTGGSAGCDSDGNIETDFLDWQSSLPEEELQRLSSHEKERQDIINELYHTERSHLRNLSILDRIFLKGIKEKCLLKEEEIQLVFPNLHEVLKIHSKFKCILKNKKIRDGHMWKNIGESLLTMFEGELGETLQKATATFCKNQQCALDLIKEKRRKDSKFNMGLNELEKNNDCRRLTLQGFIVSEMQRLAKYPLLIERLIGILEKADNSQDLEYSQMEVNSLMRAHERSKEILNHINEAAKRAWCKFRLEEIQNHLDTSLFLSNKDHAIVSEFKNIDLTNYNYVYDGPVHLKRQNKAHLQVHMVLLEEFVILLQRDSERYLLKFFQNGKPGQPPLAPIIKMSTLLVRTNAAFESSLFLVNTSAQSSMYELLTRDSAERKTWFTHLSNTVEAFKQPGGKTKSSEPLPDEEETVDELPNLQDAIERAETIGSNDTSGSEAEHGRNSETHPPNGESSIDDKSDETSVEKENTNDADSTGGGVSRKFTTEDWPLIQPSEVHADIPPVHSADIVLTPIEQIKRKGDEVSRAIDEKQNLCADVLNIDRKDFKIIADMASEANTRDPIDLVIASMNQVDLILKAVNESLTVTDAELVKGGTAPSCTSQKKLNDLHHYSPEMNDVKEAATKLNRLLAELLEVVKDKDEDFLRLRKEQEKTREQLHAQLSLECSLQNAELVDNAPTDTTQTGDLESIEESLAENDTN